MGGSMRIGSRIGGAMVGAVVVVESAMTTSGAEAAGRVQPVPLGGSLGYQDGDRSFGVYVPTRFGGVLTIKTSSGNVETIHGPDGRSRQNGGEVGNNQQGWYTFKVSGAQGRYNVSTT